jgi:endonuclease YncB( thermonuclease family)
MLKAGFATVYHERDAEYGSQKEKYIKAEKVARSKKLGMWQQLKSGNYESPGEYKKRIRAAPT